MTDNLHIWKQVEKTNPEFTSKVSQRGGFTSIDAMYNIKRATEVFGPVGTGWTYTVTHSTIDLGTHGILAVADVKIHYDRKRSESDYSEFMSYFGPVRGTHPIVTNGRVDDDAPKKAMTDAITKALSHLGFSADVFLGLHDDNKYVQQLQREFRSSAAASAPTEVAPAAPKVDDKLEAARKWADGLQESFAKIDDMQVLEKFWTSAARVRQFLIDNDRERAILASGHYARRKEALLNTGAAPAAAE